VPRQARGYDAAYERDRRGLLGRPCELQLPGCLGFADSADHVVPVSQGGRGGPLRPACHHCNSAAGAKIRRIA
jgi:5-methylcytosine-specific restriction endonuclease McrA